MASLSSANPSLFRGNLKQSRFVRFFADSTASLSYIRTTVNVNVRYFAETNDDAFSAVYMMPLRTENVSIVGFFLFAPAKETNRDDFLKSLIVIMYIAHGISSGFTKKVTKKSLPRLLLRVVRSA